MNRNDNEFEEEQDSLKDFIESRNDMHNPIHQQSSTYRFCTGNATPLVVMSFFVAVLFLLFGLFLFFSDINVTSAGLIKSPVANKIVALVIMLVISLFFLFLGFVYLKKAKKYYREKAAMESEQIDEMALDEILQRTCPKCGKDHDIDYPKCPHCKFNYIE